MRPSFISALILGLVACGGATTAPDSIPATTQAPAITQPEPTTSTAPAPTVTAVPPTTSTPTTSTPATSMPATTVPPAPDVTSTTGPAPTTTLPGDPIDLGWPAPGDVLAVVGVAHDDVLNLRQAPGTDQAILAGLSPTAADLVATGRSRSLPNSIWHEVAAGELTGWVSGSFLAYSGGTDDVTAAIVSEIGRPTAASMEALGRLVAEQAGDEDLSRITVTVAASSGDLGDVTLDVVGSGDDSVRGVRLVVFGEPVTDGYSLRSVEQTVLCGRGVTEDGLCI